MASSDIRTTGVVREAVAVFDGPEDFQRAVDDLKLAGFGRHRLSVMANDKTIEDRLGWVPGHIDQARHNPSIPRHAPVDPEELGDAQGAAIGIPAYVGAVIATGAVIASGGTALAAAAAAAVGGIGAGTAGSFLSSWLTDKRNEPYRQHLDKGGILLWVNLHDIDERKVLDILSRHAVPPVSVHEIPSG